MTKTKQPTLLQYGRTFSSNISAWCVFKSKLYYLSVLKTGPSGPLPLMTLSPPLHTVEITAVHSYVCSAADGSQGFPQAKQTLLLSHVSSIKC